MLDEIIHEHGIGTVALARRAKVSPTTISAVVTLKKGIFKVETVDKLIRGLNEIADFLMAYDAMTDDPFYMHKFTGIKQEWLAGKLGLTRQGLFLWYQRGIKQFQADKINRILRTRGKEIKRRIAPRSEYLFN